MEYNRQTIVNSTRFSENKAGYVRLTIKNTNEQLFEPVVIGEITLTRVRKGAPSTLTFSVLKDEVMGNLGGFDNGNPVRLEVGEDKTFFGFIFKKSRDKTGIISVTAYDQLRYFKNKYSFIYNNQTATNVISMLAKTYGLQVGELADTAFVIAQRVEDNVTIFNAIQNALDITMLSQEVDERKLFVMYDDFGKITLKNIEDMFSDYAITPQTAQDFKYESSIDGETYNSVVLFRDNKNDKTLSDEEHKERTPYKAESEENIKKWGLLQYTKKINEGVLNPYKTAQNILDLFNKEKRSLSIEKAFGDLTIRGGSGIIVALDLGDMILKSRMIVDKVTHHFTQSEYFMDLDVIGHKWFYGTSSGGSGGSSTKKGAVTNASTGNDVSKSVEDRYSVLAGTYYGENGCTAAVKALLPDSPFVNSQDYWVTHWYQNALAQGIVSSTGSPGDVVVCDIDGQHDGSHVVVLGVGGTYYGNSSRRGNILIQSDISDFSGQISYY